MAKTQYQNKTKKQDYIAEMNTRPFPTTRLATLGWHISRSVVRRDVTGCDRGQIIPTCYVQTRSVEGFEREGGQGKSPRALKSQETNQYAVVGETLEIETGIHCLEGDMAFLWRKGHGVPV